MAKLCHDHPSENLNLEPISFSGIIFFIAKLMKDFKIDSTIDTTIINLSSILLRITGIIFAGKVLLDRCSISNFALIQVTRHQFLVADQYTIFIKEQS